MDYALVTGASSGMGLQYALQLASRGYGIIAVSNRHEDNLHAARMIEGEYPGTDVRVMDEDLSDPLSAERIYSAVKGWGLDVEVLVSNAGILLFSTLDRTDVLSVDRIIGLHCITPARLVRLFGHDMIARGHGYILLVSSATAWMPYPTISLYGATKAFLKSFSRSVWFEMRRYGVGVTAVFPGAVDTPLYRLSDSRRALFRRLGIMQSPEKTVETALKAMFRKRYRCIPGLFSRLAVLICAAVPPAALLPVLWMKPVKRILDRV